MVTQARVFLILDANGPFVKTVAGVKGLFLLIGCGYTPSFYQEFT